MQRGHEAADVTRVQVTGRSRTRKALEEVAVPGIGRKGVGGQPTLVPKKVEVAPERASRQAHGPG